MTSLIACLTLFSVGFAQEPVVVRLELPKSVKPGAVVKGKAMVRFGEGWHGYQNPPSDPYQNPVTLKLDTKGLKLSKVTYPKGVMMDFGGTPTAVYEGEITILFEMVAPKKVGDTPLTFSVNYQQCNESTCLPPSSAQIKVTLAVKK